MSGGPLPPDFDAGGAAASDGLFGLPCTVDESRAVVVPVPWEATVSYGDGTARGPAAILRASHQVDLFDLETGRPYEHGIAMLDLDDAAQIRAWSDEARAAAAPVIAAGGVGSDPELSAAAACVDELSEWMNEWVRGHVSELLDGGKLPFVLGGDHSVPFGAIQAVAERYPGVGILHYDAHYDLRPAYGGFQWSHASVMHNVLTRLPGVERIVHVGIRDFSEEEHTISRQSAGRSVVYPDIAVRDRLADGETWRAVAGEIVEALPETVYVSIDIDGLDPALCPGTGTPVPGGLSWHESTSLLAAVVASGRRIVGGDLVEVAPSADDGEWNANVGARLLYKLIGFALRSHEAA